MFEENLLQKRLFMDLGPMYEHFFGRPEVNHEIRLEYT